MITRHNDDEKYAWESIAGKLFAVDTNMGKKNCVLGNVCLSSVKTPDPVFGGKENKGDYEKNLFRLLAILLLPSWRKKSLMM